MKTNSQKKIFKVAFDEATTKLISARIGKVDTSGSLHANERERERESEKERGCHL